MQCILHIFVSFPENFLELSWKCIISSWFLITSLQRRHHHQRLMLISSTRTLSCWCQYYKIQPIMKMVGSHWANEQMSKWTKLFPSRRHPQMSKIFAAFGISCCHFLVFSPIFSFRHMHISCLHEIIIYLWHDSINAYIYFFFIQEKLFDGVTVWLLALAVCNLQIFNEKYIEFL